MKKKRRRTNRVNDIARAEASYRRRAANSLLVFLEGLTIDGATGPVVFRRVIEPFQRQTFAALAPAVEALARGDRPPRRRFWVERTKKSGKDSDLAIVLLWLLAFARRPVYLQVGAADRDQANIVKKRMEALLHYNPWLAELITIHQYRARSVDGLAELDIMAADIAGAHGGTPDLLIVNELSHVTKWEFIQNLLDNADGVPQGVTVIATNAGFIGTSAHSLKLVVEADPLWDRFYWTEPSPWLEASDIAAARRRNSPSRYRRLWWGKWVSGKGDAFDETVIERIFSLQGPTPEPLPGWSYIGGLDLGVSHDHAAFLVLGIESNSQRLHVAWFRAWAPGAGREVDLMDVEATVERAAGLYRLGWIGYDPHQAKLMAQRLVRRGVPMVEVPFDGTNLTAMADGLKQVVDQGRLAAYDDLDGRLRRDLGKLTIEEKSYGYKLTAVSDETGHADVATALVITIPHALSTMTFGDRLRAEDSLAYDDDPTEEDVEAMPPELREIYEDGYRRADGEPDRRSTFRRRGRRRLPGLRDDDDFDWEF